MKPYFFALLIISIFLIESCVQKENNQTPNPNPEFSTGSKEGMDYHVYDTTLAAARHYPQSLKISIGGEGVAEFEFISSLSGGLGYPPQNTIQFNCLHENIELLGYYKPDTTFVYKDTTRIIYNQEYKKFFNTYYNCFRTNTKDSIRESSLKFLVSPLNAKMKFTKDSTFLSTNYNLYDENFGPTYNSLGMEGDTTLLNMFLKQGGCYNFPTGEEKYIGFRFEKTKLGWIKIKLLGGNKIYISESAVQK